MRTHHQLAPCVLFLSVQIDGKHDIFRTENGPIVVTHGLRSTRSLSIIRTMLMNYEITSTSFFTLRNEFVRAEITVKQNVVI